MRGDIFKLYIFQLHVQNSGCTIDVGLYILALLHYFHLDGGLVGHKLFWLSENINDWYNVVFLNKVGTDFPNTYAIH